MTHGNTKRQNDFILPDHSFFIIFFFGRGIYVVGRRAVPDVQIGVEIFPSRNVGGKSGGG